MKIRQIVETAAWTTAGGETYSQTIINDVIEVANISDCDPSGWWVDYCNGRRNTGANCDDLKVEVRVFAESDTDCENELAHYECWESDLSGWQEREFSLKPEYIERFGSHAAEDYIVTESEAESLAEDWSCPISDVLSMLEEI